jgi:hypothetical protein
MKGVRCNVYGFMFTVYRSLLTVYYSVNIAFIAAVVNFSNIGPLEALNHSLI